VRCGTAGNGEDDTITLGAGTYTVTTVDQETDGPNGLPSITSTLTIRGAGAEATILARDPSAPRFRLVHVAATGALTLEGLTLRGGLTPDQGGGVRNWGTVHVIHSAVTNNVADVGSGGGLCNSGIANITHTTIASNEADGAGGLDNRDGGMMSISDSRITDNGASICGGLINQSGTLTMSHTTVAGNGAPLGGGGILNGDVMTMTNSAITGNSGDFSGGLTNRGVMTITNSGAVEFQAETVTIHRAAFADRLARLFVSATSSAPLDAALAVTVPGCLADATMHRLGSRYLLQQSVAACGDLNGQTVTVTSTWRLGQRPTPLIVGGDERRWHTHVIFSLAGPPDNLALTYRSVSRHCAVETGAPGAPRREVWRTSPARRVDRLELCAGLRMQYGRRIPRPWCDREGVMR
jgi:hypothetical protein